MEGEGTRKLKLITLHEVQGQVLKGKGLGKALGNNRPSLFMFHLSKLFLQIIAII